MAKSTKKKPSINLAQAEQADGALPDPRSAYELMGIRDFKYREKSYAEYTARLEEMDLPTLHDHAYDMAIPTNPSRRLMIDRLQERYLRENPHERESIARERDKRALRTPTLDEQVDEILARGR